jgi:hypothetical protein
MNEPQPNFSGNEALLQKLALRLLASPGDLWTRDPKLLIGQLLPDLPIPLPQGSLVLGSLVRNAEQTEIVLDVPLLPEHVIDFYKAQMQGTGWREQSLEDTGGFLSTDLPVVRALFCRGMHDPSISVIAWKRDEGRADVRVFLNAGRHSPCAQRAGTNNRPWSAHDLIPSLKPPEGVKRMEMGGNAGQDSANTTTMLETDTALPVLTLADHYAAQLEKAGWTRSDEGDSGPLAWSAWKFRDEENESWWGLFFVMKLLDTQYRYFLYTEIHMSDQ